MKDNAIKSVVATGIGAALFVVIGMIRVPVAVPNTQIQLQYALQALFSLIFGPIVGFLIGFIGHAVKDMFTDGQIWWFWVIGSGVFGLVLGFVRNLFKIREGIFTKKDIVKFNIIQIIANLFFVVVSPLGDILLANEPLNKVILQGTWAFGVNSLVVGILGTTLIIAYTNTQTKIGSLRKE